MATIFSRIVQGEIPSYKIFEDERYYARLEFDRASQALKINNVRKGNIVWKTGAWSACGGECGFQRATRARTVSCWSGVFNTEADESSVKNRGLKVLVGATIPVGR